MYIVVFNKIFQYLIFKYISHTEMLVLSPNWFQFLHTAYAMLPTGAKIRTKENKTKS